MPLAEITLNVGLADLKGAQTKKEIEARFWIFNQQQKQKKRGEKKEGEKSDFNDKFTRWRGNVKLSGSVNSMAMV